MKKIFTILFIMLLGCHTSEAQWMQWECRSNNSLAEFSSLIEDMKERGYAPINLSFVTHFNDPKVSSIWQKADINNWACWYGMSREALIDKIKDFGSKGLTPIDIAVWNENGGLLQFAAIWQKIEYEGIVEIGLTESELEKKIIEYSRDGYSLRDLNGYIQDGAARYACIFDAKPSGPLIIAIGRSEAGFKKDIDLHTSQGYYPIDVSYFNDKGSIRCNGIWAKTSDDWDSRKGFSIEDFQDYLDEKTDQGYIPIDVDQYYKGGNFYYGATLVRAEGTNTVSSPKYYQPGTALDIIAKRQLPISPIEQQTQVWCWLATGEMIFKHYNVPNLNPSGNYQCGIIGSIFYNTPCYSNCFTESCIRGSGSNANTVRMFKDYSWIASQKVFNCHEGHELGYSTIKSNIDSQKPILCGISPSRRQYYSGAEHVVVLIGYEIVGQIPYVIINDPFPYASYDNPYLKSGASILQKNQYQMQLQAFTDNLFWHWSLSDIEIN